VILLKLAKLKLHLKNLLNPILTTKIEPPPLLISNKLKKWMYLAYNLLKQSKAMMHVGSVLIHLQRPQTL
jgi:hypothetical protein